MWMKLAKVSLAAVIALGTLSSVSMAKDLSEAIKGVDVSGYLRYRFNQNNQQNANYVKDNDVSGRQNSASGIDRDQHEWKSVVDFKVPTSEQFSAVVGLEYNNITGTDGTDIAASNSAIGRGHMVANNNQDGEGFAVRKFYGVWNPNGTKTTVQVGKMALATPATDGGEDRGTGILALNSDLEYVTFAAAAFDSWYSDGTKGVPMYGNSGVASAYGSIADSGATPIGANGLPVARSEGSWKKSMYALAAIAGYEGFSGQLWYFNITDMVDSLLFAQLGYDYKADSFSVGIAGQGYWNNLATGSNSLAAIFNPASGNVDALNSDYALYTVEVNGKYSILSAKAGWNGSDKKGYFVQLTDEATGVNYGGEKLIGDYSWSPGFSYKNGKNQLSAWYVAAKVDTTWANTWVGADYVQSNRSTNTGAAGAQDYDVNGEEWVLRAGWNPSKAWKMYTYYSMMKVEDKGAKAATPVGTTYADVEQNYWRVEAKYSF